MPRNSLYTLTHWGAYEVESDRNGKLTLGALPGDPDPSPIGNSIPGTLDDPVRIRQPMVRLGYIENGIASRNRRGRDPFVPVSWDFATALVAKELSRVKREHGAASIFGGSYGWASAGRFHHAQSQVHRFLNAHGGYTRSVNTYSHAALEVILPHIIGSLDGLEGNHTSWRLIEQSSELLVAFGGLPRRNAQVSAGGVGQHSVHKSLVACRDAGIHIVNVSPIRTDVEDELNSEWIALRPNTDTALMLGLAHTLVSEGLCDESFLSRYTVGFERFRDYLLGLDDRVPKTADWAGSICHVPPERIRSLARDMASKRTMIAMAWALQRAHHGEQPIWMAVTLAAMLGQIGLPGGGFGFGYSSSNRVGLTGHRFAWPALPQGKNDVRSFIPVARVTDMLLQPGEWFDYNGGRYQYPDIRLVYWAGGNPFHHQQDINRLVEGWRRPETVIVHEAWWNPVARHSDIVLPCTTSLERNDVGIARGESHFFAMRQAARPFGDVRNDYDIFADIAEHLGLREKFTEGLDEMGWIKKLYEQSREAASENDLSLPDFETFWEMGHIRLPEPLDEDCLLANFRSDPLRNPLSTPSGRIEIFSETIARFAYHDCPGHPTWLEPIEWLGSPGARQHPLHLISNQPATRLHSQLDNGSVSLGSKISQREPMCLNPVDAALHGIVDGDVVRVYNKRGECLAGAIVTESIRPGVIQLATGAWYDPAAPETPGSLDRHGNPNLLTIDRGTSKLAQGPISHSALVSIQKFAGAAPDVGAFVAPVFASFAARGEE